MFIRLATVGLVKNRPMLPKIAKSVFAIKIYHLVPLLKIAQQYGKANVALGFKSHLKGFEFESRHEMV